MTETSAEFHSLLDDAEIRLARRKRVALFLTVIPAALAIALVAASIGIVRSTKKRTTVLEARASAAIAQERKARDDLMKLESRVEAAQKALDVTRHAAENLGIVLFHQGNYHAAIRAYDSALGVDPGNVYLINLKGYSYFKLGDYTNAAKTLEHAIQLDPTYPHAYLDLARVRCAAGDLAGASSSAATAIRFGLKDSMAADGEFIRLCQPILHDLDLPAVPTR